MVASASRRAERVPPPDPTDGPPLPPPPDLSHIQERASGAMHVAFRVLNVTSTVPLLEAGLGRVARLGRLAACAVPGR